MRKFIYGPGIDEPVCIPSNMAGFPLRSKIDVNGDCKVSMLDVKEMADTYSWIATKCTQAENI